MDQAQGFDFDDLESTDSGVLTLRHPITGETIAASLTLAGPNHPKRKAVELRRARIIKKRMLNNIRSRGAMDLGEVEEDFEYELDRLVASTLGWTGVLANKQAVPLTEANVRIRYESAPWMRKQALEFLEQDNNFLTQQATR